MELKTYFAQDASGNIMPGATVMVYEAATTTLATGLQDESGSPLSNPFTADSSAKVAFYAPDGLYDITVVGNGRTVTIRAQFVSVDGSIVLRSDLAAPGGSALVGYGAGTVSDALDALSGASSVINIRDYGAALDGVTNDAAALLAANAAAVAAKLPLLIPGVAHIGTATTITAPLVDGLHQMFSVTSSVTINNGLPVRPDWWGDVENTLIYAEASLPATGGTILLESKTYKPNAFVYGTSGPGTCISKPNVKLQGRKMPRLSNDMRKLEGGTIIQGWVLAYADNFHAENIGVDAGIDVVTAYYGGVAKDGMLLTYPDVASKAASTLKRQARLHNVIGLCKDPSASVHGVIVGEGYTDVVCTGDVVGCYGIHGVVIKCANVRAESLTAWCTGGEGVIIKSDAQATAVSFDVQIGRIYANARGPYGMTPYIVSTTGYGLLFHAFGGTLGRIQIGEVQVYDYPVGIGTVFDGAFFIDDVHIGSVITDQYNLAGARYGIQLTSSAAQYIRGFSIDSVHVRNSDIGAQLSFYQTGQKDCGVKIGEMNAINANVAVQVGANAAVAIDSVSANNCSQGVYHITGTPSLTVGQVGKDISTANFYSSVSGGLVPALENGWTNRSGGEEFNVLLMGGRVYLKGLVKPGSSDILTTLPAWARPKLNHRFITQGFNGTVVAAVPLFVGAGGVVAPNEVAGGTANCSDWLSLSGISWDVL